MKHFNSTSPSVGTIEGFQCSPYPEVDQFVLSLVTKNDIKGGIRRWSYFFPEQLLVYDIFKYRWCENIGRAHKSNNIMILVDLKMKFGIKNVMILYVKQKTSKLTVCHYLLKCVFCFFSKRKKNLQQTKLGTMKPRALINRPLVHPLTLAGTMAWMMLAF